MNRFTGASRTSLVLERLLVGRKNLLQPLVGNGQTVRITHVHQALEETTFLGTTMVEHDQRVLHRDNTIVNTL